MSTQTPTQIPSAGAIEAGTPTATADEIAAATGEGTEYGDRRAELAYQLYDIGAHSGVWQCADDDERALYLRSADAVLQALPFLLWDDERERLAPLLPALALKPEEIVTGERGTVVSGEPESLECVCGNCASFEGLITATPEGIALPLNLMPTSTAVSDALAPWPEDQDELHTLCGVCGRLYRDATIRETNTAPVVRTVDLRDGTPAKNALIAHDAEMDYQP